MIENLILKLSWPNWLFFVSILVLVSIAFFYYFRTLPPLSTSRRIFLTALRAAGLIVVLFILLSPILQIISKENEKPLAAILFDNSASMKIMDSYGERGDSLKFIRDNLSKINPNDSIELRPFYFDLSLQPASSDTLGFQTDGTNIEQSLKAVSDSLSGQNLQAIILVSDGIYNQGANPVLTSRSISAPIYTVMIGDSTMTKDVVVKRLQTNQITYVDKELPIEVVVWQNGFEGENGLITLSQGKRQLARKTITFEESGFEQKVELSFIPKKAGDFNYTVQIQSMPDEITTKNNSKNVRIRTLKSKMQVLIMGGAPNFDRHFLSYFDQQLDDYQFIFLTEKSPGSYYESRFSEVKLDSIDLVVWHGFPTSRSDKEQVKRIFQEVQQRKLPQFWFLSRTTHIPALEPYKVLLPFYINSRLNPIENASVRMSGGGNLHPVMQLEESETANRLMWSGLPPLEIYSGINFKQGSQLLLQSGGILVNRNIRQTDVPVLAAYRHGGIKQLVFAGANFGFWHFQLQEDLSRDRMMLQFMDRSIRWLVNREDISQIQIQPVQRTFNLGEAVTFSGQVYDEFYQPIQDAEVTVRIKGGDKEISEEMNLVGGGFYQHAFGGLPEGEYDYTVTAERDGNKIGERSGKFTVEPFYLEYQQTAGNVELMRQLAYRSGGQFYRPAQFINSFSAHSLESRTQYSATEHFLWDHLYWLFVMIALFGIEWFFRKRWGLL